MPLNEWAQERSRGVSVLERDLAELSTAELDRRLAEGRYSDPRVRSFAERELARRRPSL